MPSVTPGIRVLCADDDLEITVLVDAYFRASAPECVVEVVHTGEDCLDRMRRGGIDVLVLDLVLPDIDGLRVLSELAAMGMTTPVVMASGHGQTDLAVRAIRAGAVDCIDKTSPEFRQLPEIVRRAFARTRPLPAHWSDPFRQHRVMLLEESPEIAAPLAKLLRDDSPRMILSIADGVDAFERLLAEPEAFDAAIIGSCRGVPDPLDALRRIRSRSIDTASIIVSGDRDGTKAVAAFKLGARDFILIDGDYATEVLFSLNNCLRNLNAERRVARLTKELAALNQSLESQVRSRTAALEKEIAIRHLAEKRAAGHADRLRILSSRLIKAHEDERRAIARELHDQIGQTLTGLKFQLERAIAGLAPPARPPLNEALALANEMLVQVREITQQFRPRILDDLGLRPALEWHAGLYHRQTGIELALDIALPDGRLAADLETTAFRVVQESLTNIARHAGTDKATVSVAVDGARLMVEVADRGRGFDPAKIVASRDSIGLTGLEERVQQAGGSLEIVSAPGRGTQIRAEFPISARVES